MFLLFKLTFVFKGFEKEFIFQLIVFEKASISSKKSYLSKCRSR